MIIKPKVRGFICVSAHPKGCAEHVREQISLAKETPIPNGPKRVLVVGSSTGYGLACRITAAFSCDADTVGIFFESPSAGKRTATAGWYNNQTFEALAAKHGRIAKSVNGDAFSDEGKNRVIELIRSDLPGGQVDLVVYSLASPKRTDPKTGQVYHSVIKPLGNVFQGKSVNFHTGEVSMVDIAPAAEDEADATVKVMGGEDWLLWMKALNEAGVLADGAATVSFSYLGPSVTHAIYTDGTIGKAKEDLEHKCREIDALLSPIGGKAFVSVNKALVTQASAAIPVVPLYMSLLFRIMKRKGAHEDCIRQMIRMFQSRLYPGAGSGWGHVPTDEKGRIRMDDWEMDPDTQREITELWDRVRTENVEELTDLSGYRADFFRLFGFGFAGVDYDENLAEY